MTYRKLSESDKQQILELYRLPGETTSTLAGRYGVSNSTVSRILKNSLSEAEYEALIQQKKRSGRSLVETPEPSLPELALPEPELVDASDASEVEFAVEAQPAVDAEVLTPTLPIVAADPVIPDVEADLESAEHPAGDQLEMPLATVVPAIVPANGARRVRKRSSVEEPKLVKAPIPAARIEAPPLETPPFEDQELIEPLLSAGMAEETGDRYSVEASAVEDLLDEEFIDQEDGLGDLDDDDLDDEDDLEDDDGDDLPDSPLLVGSRVAGKMLVQVLPLTDAPIPRTCYLVIDRSAELIARPLQDFGDLGQIPEAEFLEKTLPVFDNHRIAKRFSNPRTQRVIKLPDGKVLQKTSSHLQAKGITRLLIDGQVYSL